LAARQGTLNGRICEFAWLRDLSGRRGNPLRALLPPHQTKLTFDFSTVFAIAGQG
jgi:hypothetical protein